MIISIDLSYVIRSMYQNYSMQYYDSHKYAAICLPNEKKMIKFYLSFYFWDVQAPKNIGDRNGLVIILIYMLLTVSLCLNGHIER